MSNTLKKKKKVSRDFWLKILHQNKVILKSHKTRDKKEQENNQNWILEARKQMAMG